MLGPPCYEGRGADQSTDEEEKLKGGGGKIRCINEYVNLPPLSVKSQSFAITSDARLLGGRLRINGGPDNRRVNNALAASFVQQMTGLHNPLFGSQHCIC